MNSEPHALKHLDLEARSGLRFAVEMAGAAILVVGTTYLRDYWTVADPVLRAAIGLAPIIPLWLMLLVTVRHYFRIDEYQRLKFLQGIALTTGIWVCLNWSYPYAARVFSLAPASSIISWPFAVILVIVSAWLSRHGAAARKA